MEDKISILISTKNRKAILQQTLDVIFHHQNLPHEQFEVIVTNDGTEPLDELLTFFPYPNFKIIPNKHKPGAAGGRNNGVDHAQFELLLFLDDDILVTSTFFYNVIKIHQEYDNVILSGNRFYPEELIKIAKTYPFGRYKLEHEYQWLEKDSMTLLKDNLFLSNGLATFSASLKKSTYENVGPFNEAFEYAGCEDSEFFHRAKKIGVTLLFDEANTCYHNELDNFSLKAWLKRQSTGIKSAVVMCQLHPEGKNHPTWFTNTPISKQDEAWVKRLKIKKWFLSRWLIMKFLLTIVWVCEKLRLPDKLLFRLYNALWLGSTYKSFRKAYKEIVLGIKK
ncbi:MAG: glycosyltransferase [Bacteroidales bacterium]|nr:glycosyltransferase [Bacteroidales bacterium]